MCIGISLFVNAFVTCLTSLHGLTKWKISHDVSIDGLNISIIYCYTLESRFDLFQSTAPKKLVGSMC